MKPWYLLAALYLFPIGCILGQPTYKWFSSITVSQSSNQYIYHSSRNQVFISSIDGLNIFDGEQVKTYRPATHRMKGNNMSSTFFEDPAGKVWFTTQEALHYYNPLTDSLDYVFIVSQTGDTLRSDYSAFHLRGNDLYLIADTLLFIYDVYNRSIKATYTIDLDEYSHITILDLNNKTLLFKGGRTGYGVYTLGDDAQATLLYKEEAYVTSVCWTSSKQLWLGLNDGNLLQLDPESGDLLLQYPVSRGRIGGILELSGGRLLVAGWLNEFIEFDPVRLTILDRYIPQRVGTKESVDFIMRPYIDRDSTVWFGGAGQGVFFSNRHKQKFQHFLNTGAYQKQINVSGIHAIEGRRYLVTTRRNGIIMINDHGEILQHWLQLPEGINDFTTVTSTMINEHQLLFSSYDHLYLLDVKLNKIERMEQDQSTIGLRFIQIERLTNGKIIASCVEKGLLEIQLTKRKYTCVPYAQLNEKDKSTYYFKADREGNLYVSNDPNSINVFVPAPGNNHQYSYQLPIKGGISSLMEDKTKHGIYLTNTYGLFYIDHDSNKVTPITTPDHLLSQTIYASIADAEGNFWLSTNKGILKYTPGRNSVIAFSSLDGVQAEEFNTHAFLETADGHIFFGGVNGLNYFDPSQITPSSKAAPVYISGVKINDEFDTAFLVPQYLDTFILPYSRNTISFDFHAIDYADPGATRVKYKLVGVDPDFVISQTAKGFARYANLRHGTYTLLLLGANADGHWNETPRAISIVINPPYYLTWWFLAFCVLIAIGIIYGFVRLYFQRKLERRNQIVREQALIIEKQKAVEHERNRIASEMHDDLGSGLTTIRYLSDKALRQAKDTAEANQIRRISEHSSMLVRNMSEIIWAMNSRFDTVENLVGYLRRYASEYLEERQLPLEFSSVAEHLDKGSVGGEKRRNVFLVFKEILHNAVKYSGADRMKIEIITTHQLQIHIAEMGGKGFDPLLAVEKGNGLFNCRKRMDTAGGELIFEKTAEAMHIFIIIPLKPEAGA